MITTKELYTQLKDLDNKNITADSKITQEENALLNYYASQSEIIKKINAPLNLFAKVVDDIKKTDQTTKDRKEKEEYRAKTYLKNAHKCNFEIEQSIISVAVADIRKTITMLYGYEKGGLENVLDLVDCIKVINEVTRTNLFIEAQEIFKNDK